MPFREYDKFNDKFNARNLSNAMTFPIQQNSSITEESFYKIVSMESIGNSSQPSVASRVSTCSPGARILLAQNRKNSHGCPVAKFVYM